MRGNSHVRFLEEGEGVIPSPYSTDWSGLSNIISVP